MAEARRYGVLPTQPELALRQILQEAQHRWLRPTEVCEILRNYRKFTLTPDPPQKPQSGSLFLFDRKALRYFRKDGHSWRKKKDGKTVREAHERLKVGSVDVLHCYYAHGEDNENFQRRSYWMLEGTYEHIVLVHYREVKEGNRAGVMRPLNGYSTNALSSPTSSKQGTPCMVPTTSPQTSPLVSPRASPSISSPNTTEWSGHMNSSECDEQDSGDEPDQCIPSEFEMRSRDQGSLHHQSNGRLGDTGPSFRALQACASFSTKNLSNAGVTAHSSPPLYSTQHSNALQQGMPDFGVAQEFSVKEEKNNMLQREMSLRDYPFDVTSLPLPPPGGFDLLDWNEYLKSAKFSSVTGGSGGQVLSSPTWTDMLKTSSIMQPQNPNETSVHPKFGPVVFGPMQGLSETSFSDALERELHSGVMVHQQGLAEPEAGKTSTQHSNISDWRAVLEQLGDGGHGQINIFGGFEHEKTHQPQLHLYYQEHQHQEGLKLQQNIQQQHPFSQDDIGELDASRDNNLSHSYSQVSKDFQEDSPLQQEGHDNFKKLDSFGRWMNQEIGGDAENSIITVSSDSAPYWGDALDDQNTAEEVSSLSQQVLLGVGLSPALAPEQCFSITDFSPDYAGSSSETKVLVTGYFLETLKDPNVYKWCCMFGEIEVPVEILQPGVLRCKAPPHTPGRVPFYITRNDRFACSEVREFEFRADSSPLKNSWAPTEGLKLEQHNEEMLLQVRLARLLTSGTKGASRTQPHEGGSILSGKFSCLTVESDQDWSEMEACLMQVSHLSLNVKEQLVQRLLKDKTYELLSREAEEEGKGASVLDDHGLGVLHMGAALGYDWMIAPVLAAGVNINFRDVHGWTALHWAAYYGREKTVVALLATGAAPGAKTDPTPKFPAGQTPADLASSRRHKGIAGYLAESSLTSHLSSLTLQESMMGNESAALAGEKAVETVAERTSVQLSNSGSEDRLSLQDSLAAVRNAAQAAARIHAAFRIYSFRKRQEACESEEDEYGISDEQARSIIIAQKTNKSGRISREEAMHTAAVRIQRKFRGWKGRRDFLLFRQRIVKIQAHVRGHQVRKHYKKILWSVGIVEKAILRWRRKGRGLRGFCADIPALSGADEEQVDSDGDDFLKVGRKQTEAGLEKALARVQSMVKSREARDQYRRLVESYQKVKSSGNTDDASPTPKEHSKYGEDFSMPMTDL